jgi:hypothetical protein
MPQAFQNYVPRYEWSVFLIIKVHANKVPIKIKKGSSNPSLTQKASNNDYIILDKMTVKKNRLRHPDHRVPLWFYMWRSTALCNQISSVRQSTFHLWLLMSHLQRCGPQLPPYNRAQIVHHDRALLYEDQERPWYLLQRDYSVNYNAAVFLWHIVCWEDALQSAMLKLDLRTDALYVIEQA